MKRITEKIRVEFLENETITEETFCLVSLLDKSRLIHKHFNEVEMDVMKKYFKEMSKSETYFLIKELLDYTDGSVACMYFG